MNQQRLLELATRRGELMGLIAVQRARLADDMRPLTATIAVADRALARVDWLKRHPLVIAVLFAALVIAKPRWVLRWSERGFLLWRGWKALRARFSA